MAIRNPPMLWGGAILLLIAIWFLDVYFFPRWILLSILSFLIVIFLWHLISFKKGFEKSKASHIEFTENGFNFFYDNKTHFTPYSEVSLKEIKTKGNRVKLIRLKSKYTSHFDIKGFKNMDELVRVLRQELS